MKVEHLFEKVTADLVAAIKDGARDWRMPWHGLAAGGLPRSVDGRPYRGWNALVLAMVAADRGWTSARWATYNAWKRHGAQVRRGERGTHVVLWKPTERHEPTDEGDDTIHPSLLARTFTVFAAEQVDGAGHLVGVVDVEPEQRIDSAEAYFSAVGADVVHSGDLACYVPALDRIHLPHRHQFDAPSAYYSTAAHDPLTAPTERFDHHLGPARRCDQVALERRRMWLDRRRRGHPGRWGIWSSRVSVVSNVATINPVFGCSMQPGCR